MNKAIISSRIYLSEPEGGFDEIKRKLTYKLETKYFAKGAAQTSLEIIRNYKILPRGVLSIPQGRLDLIPEGYEIVDKRVEVDMPFPEPRLPLREEQKLVYDEVNGSCFINALVGWGKTFTALHIARKLHQKTLIITHTTMLRDQWIKEIETLFGMTPGIIGSGKWDIEPTIVVGNIQTVSKNVLELSKEFGTVIMDEGHHCPASTFTEVIDGMYSKNRIALSGTMVRKDGKHILFKDYFGGVVIRPPKSNTLDPIVKVIRPGLILKQGVQWAQKINDLLYDQEYQQFIANIAKVQMSKGHKVLIVAERVEFLTNVKELIGDACVLVTGETGFDEREEVKRQLEAGEKSCIAGSRQIFSEGISINILSCLVLPSPIANEALLEQLAGRIMRIHDNKLTPEIVDIQFSGNADKKQNSFRLGFYASKGWQVSTL